MNNIHGLNSASSARRGSGPNNGGGNGSSTPGFFGQIKSGYNGLPLFNKYLMNLCCTIYLFSWVTQKLSIYMILVPGSMLKFQVWRIFTGPYVMDSIIALIFSLLSYMPAAIIEENNMGTVPFAIRFFKLTAFINFLFCLFAIAIGMTIMP